MSSISANDLKTKGISAIEAALSDAPEAMVSVPPKSWYKSWKWWAVIGAGAGAGIAAATILTKGNSTPTITLSPGSIGIGGPR